MRSEHETVRNLLTLAAAGVLDAEEQLRLERHLRECQICRDEMAAWSVYTIGLRELPRVAAPGDLLSRARARILQDREVQVERRGSLMLLVFLALFGWSVSLAVWLLVRISTGGAMVVMETNVLRPAVWVLLSTTLAWASGATAAIVLARRRKEWRTAL